MERVFTSLNWMLGILFFAVAVFYPMLDKQFLTGSKRIVAEQVVDRIAALEQGEYQLSESYIYFSEGEMPAKFRGELGLDATRQGDFAYSAFLNADGSRLIIQARAAAQEVLDGTLPPLVFTYSRIIGSGKIEKSWNQLSGKSPGLF